MFLQTYCAPKLGIERLIITTARNYYGSSEDIVAVAVESRFNGVFSNMGIKYMQNRIPEKKNIYFVGVFHKKFGDSSCSIHVCLTARKIWNEYCNSIPEKPEDSSETVAFRPLLSP
jgi:hypothetical protein